MAVVCVAERANLGGVVLRLDGWDPLRLDLPGAYSMTPGCLARRNLTRKLGVPEGLLVLNLLPPGRVGSWERSYALEMAGRVGRWAQQRRTRLVLLGRRVAAAYGAAKAPFGEEVRLVPVSRGRGEFRFVWDRHYAHALGVVPCLVLPHPSGSNRLLNDAAFCEKMRAAAARFCSRLEPVAPNHDPGRG